MVTENEINTIWKTKSLYNAIKKHQKYLKIDNLNGVIESAGDKDKLDKHIQNCINDYHLQLWKKNGNSQSMNLINYMESINMIKLLCQRYGKNSQ